MAEAKKVGVRRGPDKGLNVVLGGARLAGLHRRVSSGQGAPLTASELAVLCHVEPRVVHEWAAKALIRSFRTPGQHLRFQLADVAQFLNKRRTSEDKPALERGETLVLCEPVRRRNLKRRLGERDSAIQWHSEPLTLLVVAGRDEPKRVVIDPVALGSLDPKAFIGALTRILPGANIVWLGKLPRSQLKRQVACLDVSQLT